MNCPKALRTKFWSFFLLTSRSLWLRLEFSNLCFKNHKVLVLQRFYKKSETISFQQLLEGSKSQGKARHITSSSPQKIAHLAKKEFRNLFLSIARKRDFEIFFWMYCFTLTCRKKLNEIKFFAFGGQWRPFRFCPWTKCFSLSSALFQKWTRENKLMFWAFGLEICWQYFDWKGFAGRRHRFKGTGQSPRAYLLEPRSVLSEASLLMFSIVWKYLSFFLEKLLGIYFLLSHRLRLLKGPKKKLDKIFYSLVFE